MYAPLVSTEIYESSFAQPHDSVSAQKSNGSSLHAVPCALLHDSAAAHKLNRSSIHAMPRATGCRRICAPFLIKNEYFLFRWGSLSMASSESSSIANMCCKKIEHSRLLVSKLLKGTRLLWPSAPAKILSFFLTHENV